MKVAANKMRPGDRFVTHDVGCTVLDVHDGRDPLGFPLVRYWCEREDTKEHGYVSFGASYEAPIDIER